MSSPTVPHTFSTPVVSTCLTHFGLYWLLAEERFGREATVSRLEELAVVEVEGLTGVLSGPEQLRMHAVGVMPNAANP